MAGDPNDDSANTEAELRAKGVDIGTCEFCGRFHWTINPGTYAMPAIKEISEPAAALAVRTVVCNHCGNVKLFNALTLSATPE
jgi:hypothetical protein